MKNKISIIIPNYNCDLYIEQCVSSVLSQSYSNFEIIVVDDGSTDKSQQIIKKIAENNDNIIYYFQNNLGGSIARNKGMEMATGDYFLFLDSDDILYPNALAKLINAIQKDDSDLVMGNFDRIDGDNNLIEHCNLIDSNTSTNDIYSLVMTIPNPTNKLYKSSIIKNNSIFWGNVKIGQDLNFYLKYLCNVKKISLINDYTYGWRYVKNSITNSFSFRLFDIYDSLCDVKRYYVLNKNSDIYDAYLKIVEFHHYYIQMEKLVNFYDLKYKKIVFNYFNYLINNLNFENCQNFNLIKKEYKNYKMKRKFRLIYCSNLYSFLYKIKRK